MFTDKNTGFASSFNYVLKSTDAGETWQYSQSKKMINDVFFIDENRGYAVGNGATILYTENGGAASIEVQKNIAQGIKVFPCPASNYLNIIMPSLSSLGKIQILNVSGQILKELFTSGSSETINIEDLSQGMYFVRIISDKINIVKFIKQ